MPQPTQAQSSNQEDRLLLAIQALKEHQFKSVRAAALSYDVPRTTLSRRMNGMTSRCDFTPNLQKLTLLLRLKPAAHMPQGIVI